jgi:predicted HNH restriction endonuclease
LKYPEVFGLEPLWDLRAVCIPCHKIIHPHMR